MRPLVYIAGPYSKPDPVENTHEAVRVATALLDDGRCAPVVPHTTLLWHLITPRPYDTWLALDLDVLARCDVLLRLPGESSGADGEVEFARAHGIPVAFDVAYLLDWVETWSPAAGWSTK